MKVFGTEADSKLRRSQIERQHVCACIFGICLSFFPPYKDCALEIELIVILIAATGEY